MKLTYVESVGIKKLEQHEKTVEFEGLLRMQPVMCFSSWTRNRRKDSLRCIFIRII